MPEIKVKHNLNQADKLPPRQALPAGMYEALIAAVQPGLTKDALQKFTIEYRIVKKLDGEAADVGGKRVFQDYVIEQSTDAERNAREAYRIRQLLDATTVTYTEESPGCFTFNSDHLVTRACKILVTVRPGNKPNADGVTLYFNNVTRVDTAEKLNESDVV